MLRSLRSRGMAATNKNPCSPEFTKEEIEAYTPSIESESSLEFFGRRRLRIANGQEVPGPYAAPGEDHADPLQQHGVGRGLCVGRRLEEKAKRHARGSSLTFELEQLSAQRS